MALLRRSASLALKSALIAACISLLGVIAANYDRCIEASGVCILATPAFWIYWAPSFLVAWAVVALLMWALRRRAAKS